jgi:hypothetical protein
VAVTVGLGSFQELVAGRRDGINHEARRLAIGRLDDELFVDCHRAGDIDDDPRFALGYESIAEGGNQPPPLGPCSFRQDEMNLGQIDDDAVWIGEREHHRVDRRGHVGDEADAAIVSDDPGIEDVWSV